MRVFSVEMLVKEEGAAVVEAALKRLKAEAARVSEELKITTDAVTRTGESMQEGTTSVTGIGKASVSAALAVATIGESFARTGTLTASSGKKILNVGISLSNMFGPTGVVVAAISTALLAILNFSDKSEERLKQLRDNFQKELEGMANAADLIGAKEKARGLQFGVREGAIDDVIDIKDGIVAINREIVRISNLPVADIWRFGRDELERLRKELTEAQRQYAELVALITNPAIAAGPAPVGASAIRVAGVRPIDRTRETERAAEAFAAFDEAYYQEAEKSFNQRYEALEKLDDEYNTALTEMMAQHARDSASAFAYQFEQEQQRIAERMQNVLADSMKSGIENGITSGLEMALAGGSIQDSFRAMGQAIVRSMASAMARVAINAIKLGKLLTDIQGFMMRHPALAVASAIAMLALARSMGGSASGADMVATGGVGGLSYAAAGTMAAPSSQIIFGATSATTAAGMTPRSSTNVTIIGPNDPTAQRAMQELLAKANSRGRIG